MADLQAEIERLEGMIADRRELYNDQVYRYDTRIAQVPANVPGVRSSAGGRATSSRPNPGETARPDTSLDRAATGD